MKYRLLIVSLLVGAALGFLVMKKSKKNAFSSTIIILNGPSASGKSTLQKAIQKSFDSFYIKVGIDNLFDAPLPDVGPDDMKFEKGFRFEQHTQSGDLIRAVEVQEDKAGHMMIPLIIGEAGHKVMRGAHNAIAAYADAGNNVVVDYILYDSAWLPDLVNALKDHRVYFIGVNIPLELLEERERARGTSPTGHGRSHYATVHGPRIYDLEIDTSQFTPEQAALKIKEFISNNPVPTAFKQLRNR